MSWLSDIGDAFSSIAKPIVSAGSSILGPVLGAAREAAPAIGGLLGGRLGGPAGAAIGSSLGSGISNAFGGGGGGGGQSQPQQQFQTQQQPYASPISPMSYSLMPTPSPNFGGGSNFNAWPQYQPENWGNQIRNFGDVFGNQAGNFLGGMGSQFMNRYVPQQYMQSQIGDIPGMMGRQAGNWLGNQLPESMSGLRSLMGSAGEYGGNYLMNRFGGSLDPYRNLTLGQLPQEFGNYASNRISQGFNQMVNPYISSPMMQPITNSIPPERRFPQYSDSETGKIGGASTTPSRMSPLISSPPTQAAAPPRTEIQPYFQAAPKFASGGYVYAH